MRQVTWVLCLYLVQFVASQKRRIDESRPLMLNGDKDRCTTIAVGPSAGIEGPMNTNTADCADCDFRLGKVPARDWPAGATRPLYQIKNNYPAVVSPNRGWTWHPDNLQGSPAQLDAWGTESVTTGFIPQV
jgi:hypothetical protein